MKNLWLAFTVLILVGCNERAAEPADTAELAADTYKIIGVKDGDTVELLQGETTEVVRLADVDCPEKKQPFGQKAKQFTSDLCFGKNVKLLGNGKRDKYKRIIGTIIIDDTVCLNKELVKAGLAWHFKRFSNDETYAAFENTAREQHIGLWRDENPVAPWEWRDDNPRR